MDRLAAGPTRSYAGTKRQLNNWLYDRMDAQLDLEARLQQEVAARDAARQSEPAHEVSHRDAMLPVRPHHLRGIRSALAPLPQPQIEPHAIQD